MAASKIAITMDDRLLEKLDFMVKSKTFPNRSKAIQEAVSEKLQRLEKTRLAEECKKLAMKYEQDLAEEGLVAEMSEWPEY